jgi:hypothetical protein
MGEESGRKGYEKGMRRAREGREKGMRIGPMFFATF